MMHRRTTIFLTIILAGRCYSNAWISPTVTGIRAARTTTHGVAMKRRPFAKLCAEKGDGTTAANQRDDGDTISDDESDNETTVEWGVSYIGGDPCGSKYNSDPFDKKPSDKPGMPDSMKARIEALAQKKLQEEQEKEN